MMALNFTLICMSPPVREGINNNNGTATVARLRRQTSSTASTVDDGNLNDGISTTSEFLPPTTTTLAETHPEHGGWQGPKSIANDGKKLKAPVFVYTSQQKAWLQWSVGIGSLVGTFPFSWLCTRYGARFVLLGAGLISAVSTALIPLAAVRHFYLFLLMRFWQVCCSTETSPKKSKKIEIF
jgi:hypothetical protein